MPETGDRENFVKGEVVIIEVDYPYDGPYTTDVVIVNESFNHKEKWDEWDAEEDKKHRSYRKFCEWLIEKKIFEPIDFNVFTIIEP